MQKLSRRSFVSVLVSIWAALTRPFGSSQAAQEIVELEAASAFQGPYLERSGELRPGAPATVIRIRGRRYALVGAHIVGRVPASRRTGVPAHRSGPGTGVARIHEVWRDDQERLRLSVKFG